jgi:hypothetical protein
MYLAKTGLYLNKKSWEELIRLFPYIKSFEELEPNLIKINLNELTLTSFNSISLNSTEFTAVNNLVAMVTINNTNAKFSKAHLTTLNLNTFKMIEAIGLKIIVSRYP